MKARGQKASQAGGYGEEEGDKSMIEEGNENLNQGNILLAPRTEAEEERAKDEREGGGRGEREKKMKGGKSGGQWEGKRVEGEKG